MTLTPGLTGDGAIFEVTRPWSPREARFRQITPKSLAVFETEIFKGRAVRGHGRPREGLRRLPDDRDGARYRFEPIVDRTAPGRGQTATSVVSMHVFETELYVGSSGWYNEEEFPVSELIRIDPEGDWQVVAGAPRERRRPAEGADQRALGRLLQHLRRPLLADGDLRRHARRRHERLELAGADRVPGARPVGDRPAAGRPDRRVRLRPVGQLRRRGLGPVTRNAFGSTTGTTSARATSSPAPAGCSSAAPTTSKGTTASAVPRPAGCDDRPPHRDAARPRRARVLTDVQRQRTVLSWRGTGRGHAYRVLRAATQDAPVGLVSPQPPAGSGRRPAPGRRRAPPVAPGRRGRPAGAGRDFEPIGTTTRRRSSSTARPSRRALRLPGGRRRRARRARSARSERPDGARPAVRRRRWRGAQRLLGRSALRGSAGPAAVAPRSGTARSADAGHARPGSRRGGAAATGPCDMLERLERRVRYAGAAGRR